MHQKIRGASGNQNIQLVVETSTHTIQRRADNVGLSVAVHIGQLAQIGVVAFPPAAFGPRSERAKLESRSREMPAAGRQRNIKTCAAETDDIRLAVAIHVGQFAQIGVVTAPAASRGSECSNLIRHRREAAPWRRGRSGRRGRSDDRSAVKRLNGVDVALLQIVDFR